MPAPSCADVLERLHTAVLDLQTGKRASTVSFGDRSATYVQSQLKDLLMLYRVYYRKCGEDSGYPDLSATVERGPPLKVRLF